MSAVDYEVEHVPDQLVDQLVRGYDALTAEVKALNTQRQELENKLSWAKQQYLDALKRYTPSASSPTFRTFLSELDEAGATQREGEGEWLASLAHSSDEERKLRAYEIQKSSDAREKIRFRRRASDASRGVKIWSGRNADSADSGVVMERDFTVAGTPGHLGCPFAKRFSSNASANGTGRGGTATTRSLLSRTASRRSKRPSLHDPIRAEICGVDPESSTAPSVEGSAPLCPIRFLDQHSPEEVAKYFEKHKHELPRSHELCVKRYQSNEESIRQLDQKYGNLVSMIQGLGIKHQNMFPEKEDLAVEDGPEEEAGHQKIGQWARTVGESTEVEAAAPGEEDRLPRFDRPLKEIRVGESPSRPWGISVPLDYDKTPSIVSPALEPAALPLEQKGDGNAAKAKCPFDHPTRFGLPPPKANHPAPQTQEHKPSSSKQNESSSIDSKSGVPAQMVFNGPVFIGYPMEQALAFLQHSGLGKGGL